MEKVVKFLTPTWEEIEELAIEVAEEIREDDFKPDVVIGVLRGGVIPAKLIADYLGVDNIATLEVKLYTGIGARRPEPHITQPVTIPLRGLKVLVVDDVVDTGKTLSTVKSFVKHYGPSELRTATLYVKPWASLKPDYYGEVVDAWIVFPWERLETLRELIESMGFKLEEAAEIVGLTPEDARRLMR